MKRCLLLTNILLILCILTGCGNNNAAKASDATTSPPLLAPVDTPINTVEVGYHDILIASYHNAVITPYVEQYAFNISGDISTIHFKLQDTVKKGDLLIELDHSAADNRINELKESIATLTDIINLQNEEYSIIINNLKTQKDNITSGKTKSNNPTGDIELIDCDIAIYEAKIRQNDDKLALDTRELREELTQLENSYYKYFIYSSMDGTVAYISPVATLEAGTTAISITDLNKKYIQTDVCVDKYVANALSIYATHRGVTYKLTHVPSTTETDNANLKNTGKYLSNFVTDNIDVFEYGDRLLVTIDTEHIENVLSIPNTAIFSSDNGAYVYTVNEKGIRQRQSIVTGKTDNIYTSIIDGLKEGDVIYVPN